MSSRPEPPAAMPVLDHLEALRRVILASLLFVGLGTIAGLALARPIIEWLKTPVQDLVRGFVLLRPTEVVGLYFKVGLSAGLVLSSPAVAAVIWRFIKPGLPPEWRPRWPGWIAAALALFAGGVTFAYRVLLPIGFKVLWQWSADLADPLFSLGSYLSLALAVLLLAGVVFEMPLVIGWLARAGLVTPRLLRSRRREAWFGMLAAAAVLTPTTDVVNLLLFALPLVILYEASIWVAVLAARKAKILPGEEAYQHGSD